MNQFEYLRAISEATSEAEIDQLNELSDEDRGIVREGLHEFRANRRAKRQARKDRKLDIAHAHNDMARDAVQDGVRGHYEKATHAADMKRETRGQNLGDKSVTYHRAANERKQAYKEAKKAHIQNYVENRANASGKDSKIRRALNGLEARKAWNVTHAAERSMYKGDKHKARMYGVVSKISGSGRGRTLHNESALYDADACWEIIAESCVNADWPDVDVLIEAYNTLSANEFDELLENVCYLDEDVDGIIMDALEIELMESVDDEPDDDDDTNLMEGVGTMNTFEYLRAISEATSVEEIEQLNEEGPIAWAKAKASNLALEMKGRRAYNKRMKAIEAGRRSDFRGDTIKKGADERNRLVSNNRDREIASARRKADDKSMFYGKYAKISPEERAAKAEEKAAKRFDRRNGALMRGIKRDYDRAEKYYKQGEKRRGTSREYEAEMEKKASRWKRIKKKLDEKYRNRNHPRPQNQSFGVTAETFATTLVECCAYGIPDNATLSEGYSSIMDIISEACDALDQAEFDLFMEAAMDIDDEFEGMVEDAIDHDLDEDSDDYDDDDTSVVGGLEEAMSAGGWY